MSLLSAKGSLLISQLVGQIALLSNIPIFPLFNPQHRPDQCRARGNKTRHVCAQLNMQKYTHTHTHTNAFECMPHRKMNKKSTGTLTCTVIHPDRNQASFIISWYCLCVYSLLCVTERGVKTGSTHLKHLVKTTQTPHTDVTLSLQVAGVLPVFSRASVINLDARCCCDHWFFCSTRGWKLHFKLPWVLN